MKFKLILSAEYKSEQDVDDDQVQSLSLRAYESDQTALEEAKTDKEHKSDDEPEQGTDLDDSTLDNDSLEQQELTETEKATVNKTAQYIVYGVIIIMAFIFTIGICLLIYWWCCHEKMNKRRMNENIITNSDDDRNGRLIGDAQDQEDDERKPFIDIRGAKTLTRQHLRTQGRTIYFGIGVDRETNDDIDILQRDRHNVYDDINGADENEDGDDLIAHYGSTDTSNNINTGYVIAKCPDKSDE